jgi:hypothetical protein
MMFNIFDVIVPTLLPLPTTGIRQHSTAFGPDEGRYLYVGEVRLARVLPTHAAYRDVRAWTGSGDRGNWTALVLHEDANAAAINDRTWAAFLGALQTLLLGHPRWRVRCESDCDQYAIEKFSLAPDTLVRLLDSYRENRHFPIAFSAEFPDPAK